MVLQIYFDPKFVFLPFDSEWLQIAFDLCIFCDLGIFIIIWLILTILWKFWN